MFIYCFVPPTDRVVDIVHVRDIAFGKLGVSHFTRLETNKFSILSLIVTTCN